MGTGAFPTLIGRFADGTILGRAMLLAGRPATDAAIVRPYQVLLHLTPAGEIQDSLVTVPGDEVAILQGIIA